MNHIQSRQFLALTLATLTFAAGCMLDPLSTPPPDVTTNPSQQQIQYCRDVMYIDPDLVLRPLGYYYEHGFQDDQIAFKFIAETDRIENIFQAPFVLPAKLVARKSSYGLVSDIGEKWWDPQTKALVGGNFIVPPPGSKGTRFLNVGIVDNDDATCTVYAYWCET